MNVATFHEQRPGLQGTSRFLSCSPGGSCALSIAWNRRGAFRSVCRPFFSNCSLCFPAVFFFFFFFFRHCGGVVLFFHFFSFLLIVVVVQLLLDVVYTHDGYISSGDLGVAYRHDNDISRGPTAWLDTDNHPHTANTVVLRTLSSAMVSWYLPHSSLIQMCMYTQYTLQCNAVYVLL